MQTKIIRICVSLWETVERENKQRLKPLDDLYGKKRVKPLETQEQKELKM